MLLVRVVISECDHCQFNRGLLKERGGLDRETLRCEDACVRVTYAMKHVVASLAVLLVVVLDGCFSDIDMGGCAPESDYADAGALSDAGIPDTCPPDASETQ